MQEDSEKALKNWQGRLNTALVELLIFRQIAKKPEYGGKLVKLSRKLISPDLNIPTIYATLKRSIKNNLVVKIADFPIAKSVDTRGTARQYYALTEEGKIYTEKLLEFQKNVMGFDIIKYWEGLL